MTDLNDEAATRQMVPKRTRVSSKLTPKAEVIYLPV
jgi:hypothetical protein